MSEGRKSLFPENRLSRRWGSMPVGPSEDYKKLLRGEITSEEYVRRLKEKVDRRHRERD